jgi:YD repeat-containing protein
VDQTGIGGLPSVSINQRKRPADYQDSTGRMWEVLLVFTSGGGSDTKLNVKADFGAQADGVMLMELGPGFSQNIYDDAGQLKSSIDLRGQTTTYQYDALGRQKVVTLPDPDGPVGAGISPQTDFFYDKVGKTPPRESPAHYSAQLPHHQSCLRSAQSPHQHYRCQRRQPTLNNAGKVGSVPC